MVLNHTARWWMNGDMGWSRYYFIYYTLALGVPIWLFLVGFSLSLSFTKTALLHPTAIYSKTFRYIRRGLMIILSGYALNILIFPEDPWYGTTALHTIGLGMIASAPLLFILQHPLGRILVLAASPLFYLSFIGVYPELYQWVTNHPKASPALFFDFAPWPWMAAVFFGLIPGWLWIIGPYKGWFECSQAIRFTTILGIVLIVMFIVLQWIENQSLVVDFRSDLLLNNHWIPKPITTLLMYGTFCLLFSVLYWIVEIQQIRLEWLMILGKTTFSIFFIHHLIGLIIAKRWLGIYFNHWLVFVLAVLSFIVLLVSIGQLILQAKASRAKQPGGHVQNKLFVSEITILLPDCLVKLLKYNKMMFWHKYR